MDSYILEILEHSSPPGLTSSPPSMAPWFCLHCFPSLPTLSPVNQIILNCLSTPSPHTNSNHVLQASWSFPCCVLHAQDLTLPPVPHLCLYCACADSAWVSTTWTSRWGVKCPFSGNDNALSLSHFSVLVPISSQTNLAKDKNQSRFIFAFLLFLP